MTLVRNISDGPRGAWLEGRLVMAESGQAVEAEDWAEEWFAPVDAEALPQLDHDHDGKPGGSLPGRRKGKTE